MTGYREDGAMKKVYVVKAALPMGSDEADGIQREWFKVGHKQFGVTADGKLLDGDGRPMSGIDERCYVVHFVHDDDAFRVAEAIRASHAARAYIASVAAAKPPAGWQRDADIDSDDAAHNRPHH
jgi:hypothetical protein